VVLERLAEMGDDAEYPWGDAGYIGGRLVFLFYKPQIQPNDRNDVFAQLGLPFPNDPYIRESDGTMIWSGPPFNSRCHRVGQLRNVRCG
jgi:hypothetical protein